MSGWCARVGSSGPARAPRRVLMGFADGMRSDDLVWVSEFLEMLGELNAAFRDAFGSVIRVRAVLDTNLVLGDLKWLVVEREDPAARPAAQEAIAAGTVIAYAPEFLRLAGVVIAGFGGGVVVGPTAASCGLGKQFMRATTIVKLMLMGSGARGALA